MKIQTKFDIGQMITLKTDRDKLSRMVTNIKACPNDNLIYYVVCGEKISEHYEIEMSEQDTSKERSAGFINQTKER
jgi:hypothetical protein